MAAKFPDLRFAASIKVVYASWIVAMGLAVVAGTLGSRRWLFAALLPVFSFTAFVAMTAG